ncbi:MAG TPA: bifunctional 4-hydroxy-2-oxoglutarate aldolase/2-dehydro-3-deoxy-phosphogluconate aldolase [Vicinamibacteria bacterium]|nr:bifunctional 4-hydroxy-2-oxoglutarate aldolase/2-dehydro-3-deoxy-phosphogluconate aldolase [Vicinamibacteria bacterium]
MTTREMVLGRIRDLGLVPVVRAQSAEEASRAIDAIRAGGIDVLEVTMTVPDAVGLIAQVAKRFGQDAVIGAGTVLDAETARACILAGAQFVVTPTLRAETIACCRRYGVPVLPGALTPTEVLAAWESGADMVKVFPCSAVGGASYIKALKAPLPQVELVPTGGVNLETAAEFIRAGASALGLGSDLVDLTALREGRAAAVTERARKLVAIVQTARKG